MNGSWKHIRLRAGLVLLITFVTYLPALRDGFVWDDVPNITENESLRTVEGLKEIWINPHGSLQYYPLTYTGFWIEYHLWALRPLGYHCVNVLLHALNAVLLGVLLESLAVPGAWLAALIFAVHPVHVESVAWVTELKNVLSGFCFLASALAWLRYRHSSERRGQLYGLALVLFLCSLLAKTSTVSLPLVLLAVIWWKDGRVTRKDVWPLVPFFLATPMVLVTAWVEKHYVGAIGAEWQLTLVQRCLVAGRAVWFYAGKLVWPHPQMFVYPRWHVDAAMWWQYLFPLSAVAVVVLFWLFRRQWGKGPFVAVLFFVGMTAPVPAFFNLYFMQYSYVGDHFQYLGSMGLIALAAAGAAVALRNRAALIAVAAPVLIVLGALSWQHTGIFRDGETLWRDTIAHNPDGWMAHVNLAKVLFDQGNIEESIAETKEVLRLKPGNPWAYDYLGICFARQGKLDEALAEFSEEVQVDPQSGNAHNNLGRALGMKGKLREAQAEFVEALRLKPDFREARNNLGLTLAAQGDYRGAIQQYLEALRSKPDYPEATYNFGVALAGLGRLDDAGRVEQHALTLATAAGQNDLARAIQHLLEQYKAQQQPVGANSNAAPPRRRQRPIKDTGKQIRRRLDPCGTAKPCYCTGRMSNAAWISLAEAWLAETTQPRGSATLQRSFLDDL